MVTSNKSEDLWSSRRKNAPLDCFLCNIRMYRYLLFWSISFNRSTGLIASGILATCCLYFSLVRLIILDMPLSIQITLSLYCFYKGFYSLSSLQRRFWFYGFSNVLRFWVFDKGIIALALSGPIIFLWLTWTRQWNRIFPLYILVV